MSLIIMPMLHKSWRATQLLNWLHTGCMLKGHDKECKRFHISRDSKCVTLHDPFRWEIIHLSPVKFQYHCKICFWCEECVRFYLMKTTLNMVAMRWVRQEDLQRCSRCWLSVLSKTLHSNENVWPSCTRTTKPSHWQLLITVVLIRSVD